ncbi:hypothetical protein [Alicyclobacillus macrosporangiidus]|uniref:Uncharacterized protein n=1 Tax=Alicyclobacillus macrosporangiidus TaxID=392015 RepID=A0A1I7I9Q8_9BACL|nr:hypothetical protein [Alicyclobacillus macrosporangiidus]SFU69584.1 hypothetical protein SAMN05421543_10684 [Alicyclobacillus macrosporangiidus]
MERSRDREGIRWPNAVWPVLAMLVGEDVLEAFVRSAAPEDAEGAPKPGADLE